MNCVDDDCSGLVDDTFQGQCTVDGVSNCMGSVACDGYAAGDCPTSVGCTLDQGRCSESGVACGVDADCGGGSDVCEGASCTGGAACSQFESQGSCEYYETSGCTWNETCDWPVDQGNCEAQGCDWNCDGDVEICSNGVDDDGDGLVDCMDPACNAGGSLSLSDGELSRHNCLGTDQTGDVEGLGYYCSVPAADDSVGLCCLVGQEAYYDSDFGVWQCGATDPCYPEPPYICSYEYSSAFDQWLGDAGCVDSSAGKACCSVVQFGEEDYWSDSDNVKVY